MLLQARPISLSEWMMCHGRLVAGDMQRAIVPADRELNSVFPTAPQRALDSGASRSHNRADVANARRR